MSLPKIQNNQNDASHNVQEAATFFLYKELHEPNSYGFERMSAMNTDLIYEYSDLSYEY